jgi:uncharacterized protein (DUF433 family)
MRWQDYVRRDPKILVGKPTFIGTRISVEMVLEELSAGATAEEIVKSHPSITIEHIRAALAYAAASLRRDEVVFLDAEPAK